MPRSARVAAAVAMTDWRSAEVTTVDAGAKGAGIVSRVSSASPIAIFESRTMSQWSLR